jgi:hypothetical protein
MAAPRLYFTNDGSGVESVRVGKIGYCTFGNCPVNAEECDDVLPRRSA